MTIEKWVKEYGNHTAVAHIWNHPYGEYNVETGDKKYDRTYKSYRAASKYLSGFGYARDSVTIDLTK